MPSLSLLIASRNDAYMGNSLWRLQTALNYTAISAARAGRLDDVEILVTDWGSVEPLRGVLRLSAAAARIVSFLHVSPGEAAQRQKDSSFPEVLALNAAARRARGTYIGRIDNDTLVHRRFFEHFFRIERGDGMVDGVPLQSALIFTNRRQVPYRFAERGPALWQVDRFVEQRGPSLLLQTGETFGKPFHYGATGIWLLHRSLWAKAGGYDESLIHWGWIEQDMIHRLLPEHPLIEWDRLFGCDFFHLEHYNPRRRRVTERKGNTAPAAQVENPNGPHWGLADLDLPLAPSPRAEEAARVQAEPPADAALRMQMMLLAIHCNQLVDAPFVFARRTRAALGTLSSRPARAWPDLLRRWLRILLG